MSFVGDSQQFRVYACVYSPVFSCISYRNIRVRVCARGDACILDLYTRSCARFRTHIQCISRSLWLGAIRKLYSKRLAFNPPGNLTPEERDGMLKLILRRVFDTGFDAVDQENGKRIRSCVHESAGRKFGFWIATWTRWCCANLPPLTTWRMR